MKQTNLQDSLRKNLKTRSEDDRSWYSFFLKRYKNRKNVSIDPYVVFGQKVKIQNNVKIFLFHILKM